MIKFSIPHSKDVLFETVLEPEISVSQKLETDMGEGELKMFLGKKNKVAVGVPYYENLVPRILAKEERIPHEIEQLIKRDYDFHFVSLSCSFLPDKDCKFMWARFGIELTAEPTNECPIAYDMFPQEVLTEFRCKREGSLTPQLKFDSNILSADLKLGSSETKEYVTYEPQIYSFGINRPNVAWDFRTSKEKGIWGNKNGLNLIIRTPKDSRISGRFLIAAEVACYVGNFLKIPLAKRKDNIADAVYKLS